MLGATQGRGECQGGASRRPRMCKRAHVCRAYDVSTHACRHGSRCVSDEWSAVTVGACR